MRLPGQPAAVLVYGSDGTARCVSLDFDVSRGGQGHVEADVERLTGLLGRCGAGWFADRSPSGGRHVYVPLAVPVGFVQVRQVALALRLLLPSLDVSPLVNLTAGCIRPPGARHRTGGWQTLDGSLTAAARLVGAPNGPQVWAALLEHLAPQLDTLALDHPAPDDSSGGETGRGEAKGSPCGVLAGQPTTGSAAGCSGVLPAGAAGAAGPKERAAYLAGTACSTSATAAVGSTTAGAVDRVAAAAGAVSDDGAVGSAGGEGPGRLSSLPTLRSFGLAVGRRPLRAAVLQVARTGVFDQARYRSPSEARQAVLASAAASGWSWTDVTSELEAGRWPGLWGFYARYAPRHRREALAGDWLAALTYARQLPSADSRPDRSDTRSIVKGPAEPHQSHVHSSHTREPTTHGGRGGPSARRTPTRTPAKPDVRRQPAPVVRGRASVLGADGEFGFVRSWWSAVLVGERDRYRGRRGQTTRLVLRALGAAAQKTGRRHVAFGVRSLSLACGVSPSTVAAVLGRLRQESDPFVLLVEAGRGLQGDLYELRIPTAYEQQALALAWRPGKITALLPVFRHLGVAAAFVYEALDTAAHSSWDLAAVALLSTRAAQHALAELAANGLAVRDRQGWRRGPADPTAVARSLGVLDRLEELLERYRAHRQGWRERLLAGGLLTVATVLAATRPSRPHPAHRDQSNQPADPGERWLPRQAQPPPAAPGHRGQAGASAPATAMTCQTDSPPDAAPRLALAVPDEVLELLRLELGAVVLT